ncbi:MAG: thioesterase family protein [Chloroflexota bacterium]
MSSSTAPTDRYIAATDFYVRYAETDAQGVVHHASYIVWLEEARSHYARSVGSDYADFERAGYFMSVIAVEIRYRAPARYGSRVVISCWVQALKSRTVTFGYEVRDVAENTLHATASTEHICITREGQVVAWPTDWKQKLADGLPS